MCVCVCECVCVCVCVGVHLSVVHVGHVVCAYMCVHYSYVHILGGVYMRGVVAGKHEPGVIRGS